MSGCMVEKDYFSAAVLQTDEEIALLIVKILFDIQSNLMPG